MNLFPRLPLGRARTLADELSRLPRKELRDRSATWDDSVLFAPIGGQRVDRELISRVQGLVRLKADAADAEQDNLEAARRRFDFEIAVVLYDEMALSPHEASQLGVWAFLACIVLPDVVRWRFPGDGDTSTRPERFLGGARGIRNTFGRLWWRAFTLVDPDHVDRWHLVRPLLEDQAVAILERPIIAGYPKLARAVLARTTASRLTERGVNRQDATRELSKRLRRLAAVVPLETLPVGVLDDYVDRALMDVERALAPGAVIAPPPEVALSAAPTTGDDLPAGVQPAEGVPRAGVEFESQEAGAAIFEARLGDAVLGDGAHHGWLSVPVSVASHLPALNESYVNPDRNIFVVDDNGQRWLWRFVHYNRASDQHRLEGLAAFLAARGAKVGDRLRLIVAHDGAIKVELITSVM